MEIKNKIKQTWWWLSDVSDFFNTTLGVQQTEDSSGAQTPVANFSQLIYLWRDKSDPFILSVLDKLLEDKNCYDYTEDVCEMERKNLFDWGATHPIDLIVRELEEKNIEQDIWKWVDTNERIAVHFMKTDYGVRAEAYVLCSAYEMPTDESFLHLVESSSEKCYFIPVFFTENLAKKVALAEISKDYMLCYLPRVQYEFLSKKGKKTRTTTSGKELSFKDNGDFL